ncbi:Uncharacterised protein [uncultured archaeon]|nr:Uncharacterised protein [uncultured archaeon]
MIIQKRREYWCLFFLLVIIFILPIVFAAEIDCAQLIKNKDSASKQDLTYCYGKNIDDFVKLPHATQESYFKKNPEQFLKGLSESIDENKVGKQEAKKNLDKFADSWIKKDDKGNVLSDDVKNKVWKHFSEGGKQNDFFKSVANKLFWQKYDSVSKSEKWKDPSKVGIDSVNLNDKDGKLVWKGNKLGLVDSKGEFNGWVDLENPARWLDKVEFNDGKFNLGFDTGFGKKDRSFSQGTIGKMGELIGPDGKEIGARMNEGLTSVEFKDNKFVCTYKTGEKEKTISIGPNDLGDQLFNNIKDAIKEGAKNNPSLKIDTSNLDSITKDQISEALKGVGQIGVDFRSADSSSQSAFPTNNRLNVLWGKGDNKMDISYDSKGNPELKAYDGAMAVTTTIKGGTNVVAKQWSLNDNNAPEAGVFRFNKYGEFVAGQNTIFSLYNKDNSQFGTTYLSRAELIGVNIVDNSFANALARGDPKAAAEAVLKDSDIIKRTLSSPGGFDTKAELLSYIKEQLKSPETSVELKNRLSDALASFEKNYDIGAGNLMTYAISGNAELSPQDKATVDAASRTAVDALKAGANQFFSDPSNAEALLRGDKGSLNKFLNAYLGDRLADPSLSGIISNDFSESVAKIASKGKTTSQLLSEINGGIDFESLIDQSGQTAGDPAKLVAENIDKRLRDLQETGYKVDDQTSVKIPISDNDRQAITNAVTSIVSEAESKISQERQAFRERMKQDMELSSPYKNQITIDQQLKEVKVESDKVVYYDAKTPLNEFSGKSTKTAQSDSGSVINLWSNGRPVLTFDGDKTYAPGLVAQENYYPIGSMVNAAIPGKSWTLMNLGEGYNIYDSKQVVEKFADWGTATVVAKGFEIPFSTTYNVIRGNIKGDIGADPNAAVSITYQPNSDWGGPLPGRFFIGRIVNNYANNKANEEAQKESFKISEFTSKISSDLDKQYGEKMAAYGGEANLVKLLENSKSQLEFADKWNVNIPNRLELEDNLYLGSKLLQGKEAFKAEFNKVLTPMSQQSIKWGEGFQITNNAVYVGQNKVVDGSGDPGTQVVLRTLVRQISANPSRLTAHQTRVK